MPPRVKLTPRPPHTFDRTARILELESTVEKLVEEIDRLHEAGQRFAGYRQELVSANHTLMSDLRAVCNERDLLRLYIHEGWCRLAGRLFSWFVNTTPPVYRGPATEHVEANYQVDGDVGSGGGTGE